MSEGCGVDCNLAGLAWTQGCGLQAPAADWVCVCSVAFVLLGPAAAGAYVQLYALILGPWLLRYVLTAVDQSVRGPSQPFGDSHASTLTSHWSKPVS